jgi:hypothetical protein
MKKMKFLISENIMNMAIPVISQGFTATLYTVTRPYLGFRHSDWMAPDQMAKGSTLPSPMLVFYIPPCRKTFRNYPENLPCEKKKECEQEGLNSGPYPVVYPETTVTLHESSKYEILSLSCRKYFRHGGM